MTRLRAHLVKNVAFNAFLPGHNWSNGFKKSIGHVAFRGPYLRCYPRLHTCTPVTLYKTAVGILDQWTRLDRARRATWPTRETNARWCVGLSRGWRGDHVLRDPEDGRRRGGAALDVCFEFVPVPVFWNGGGGVEIFAGLAPVLSNTTMPLQ